jgi:hypothetical protein
MVLCSCFLAVKQSDCVDLFSINVDKAVKYVMKQKLIYVSYLFIMAHINYFVSLKCLSKSIDLRGCQHGRL